MSVVPKQTVDSFGDFSADGASGSAVTVITLGAVLAELPHASVTVQLYE